MKRGENQQQFASPEEALKHHGVKGMKWGVRNEDDLTGLGRISQPPSGSVSGIKVNETEYHRLAGGIAKKAGVDSNLAASKYGSPGMQGQIATQRQVDREKLKKVALIGGVTLGAAAAGIAIYKLNQAGVLDNLPGADTRKLFTLLNTNSKAYGSAVDGLNINWEHGVSLPKGSIIRRLSSVAETVPRPEGFYAAHLDSDVDSYKAILPTFWNQWGVGDAKKGGFLNHYKANEAIRAPSGKESFELFKHLINTDDRFDAHFSNPLFGITGLRGLSDAQLKKRLVDSSINWAEPNNAFTKHWFDEVRKRGYNALIDFNDAGKLGKTPIRVLDGNMFDIVKNEPQTLNDFYTAAKKWSPELVHIYTLGNGEFVFIHADNFVRVVELGRDVSEMMANQK